VKTSIAEYLEVLNHRFQGSTPLLKDPIAFFCAEWLAERFDTRVVVLIRHTAAFVSIKKLNWEHPFGNFLEQDLMMKDILEPFKDEIKEYSIHRKDISEQAILLWRIIHYQVLKYQEKHPEWIFVKHEDLSQDTLQGFQIICEKLNLKFTQKVKTIIEEYSGAINPSDPSEPVGSESTLKRSSKSNI